MADYQFIAILCAFVVNSILAMAFHNGGETGTSDSFVGTLALIFIIYAVVRTLVT